MLKKLEKLKEQIKNNYSSGDICTIMDLEMLKWDFGYTEEEIMEMNHYSRYDFYIEYGHGEGENAVCEELLQKFGTSRNELCDEDLLEDFEDWLSEYSGINFSV